MSLDQDINGILSLLRTHIEIRNRSWMKQVHRDCFIGSDAVDFLVNQGFAENRKQAVALGQEMVKRKLIRHVSSKSKKFQDAYLYYRFAEDDLESSILAPTNAGNGSGTYLGHGGCKFSFCPHTVHNSYILDIALAEEIERAVAGASIEARAVAINKLRARVREAVEPDAPDWMLVQTSEVNKTPISIFQKKRPRGDFRNVKMTGMVADSANGFIRGIMSFDKRKQWEGMFEDGVIVEAVDIGEKTCAIFNDEDIVAPNTETEDKSSASGNIAKPILPDNARAPTNLVRATDDVLAFLQTVDVAGIPAGMPIGFLNDPERQHALAHLRKQMMLSNPQECMLCQIPFESAADIRFCPCCAMVSCGSCVSRRVFEVVSRQVVSVCIHCFRESSRIRHPPQAVQDTSGIDAAVVGKWWRPEDLGIVDYSNSAPKPVDPEVAQSALVPGLALDDMEDTNNSNNGSSTPKNNKNLTSKMWSALKSTIGGNNKSGESDDEGDDDTMVAAAGEGDGVGLGINEEEFVRTAENFQAAPESPMSPTGKDHGTSGVNTAIAPISPTASPQPAIPSEKMARCKTCGAIISRDVEAIEEHMAECTTGRNRMSSVMMAGRGGNGGNAGNGGNGGGTLVFDGTSLNTMTNTKTLAGVPRRHDLDKSGTRIIYRTARPQSKMYAPREVCAFQDAFVDKDGTSFVYEVSVRHCDVRGLPGYVTADVMLLLHAAKPVKNVKNMCNITIISQVDTRVQGPQWLMSFITDEGSIGNDIGGLRRDDLVRELKACGDLQNILNRQDGDDSQEEGASLDDFDLLAVLGRGGFGKVMQVRHRPTGVVYAMKILKKSELRRRRQVERTQTERTILAAVRHPFIVCLHYAFQNAQKLYMVMDFVQGGDFFTLMRKFRRLPEDWVRLYIGEIALALQHLHDMDVVYRDLKPENILLDGQGHIKLTDFGLSRFFETRPPAAEDMIGEDDIVTRSFCGTEQYMSPEMLLQQGHNYRMDWWCVGLLMHEMISARHPFQGPSHYDTLRNMVTKQPNIDSKLSPQAAVVVRGLLVKNPKARMCCKEGQIELRNSPFFATLDWDALYERRIEMPYRPDLKGATDISSFEATFTKEAPVDSVVDNKEGKAKKGTGKRGIMGLFGLGSSNNNAQADQNDGDVFKGFSFNKEEVPATAGNDQK